MDIKFWYKGKSYYQKGSSDFSEVIQQIFTIKGSSISFEHFEFGKFRTEDVLEFLGDTQYKEIEIMKRDWSDTDLGGEWIKTQNEIEVVDLPTMLITGSVFMHNLVNELIPRASKIKIFYMGYGFEEKVESKIFSRAILLWNQCKNMTRFQVRDIDFYDNRMDDFCSVVDNMSFLIDIGFSGISLRNEDMKKLTRLLVRKQNLQVLHLGYTKLTQAAVTELATLFKFSANLFRFRIDCRLWNDVSFEMPNYPIGKTFTLISNGHMRFVKLISKGAGVMFNPHIIKTGTVSNEIYFDKWQYGMEEKEDEEKTEFIFDELVHSFDSEKKRNVKSLQIYNQTEETLLICIQSVKRMQNKTDELH